MKLTMPKPFPPSNKISPAAEFNNPEFDEKMLESIHSRASVDPYAWRNKGRELRKAADVILQAYQKADLSAKKSFERACCGSDSGSIDLTDSESQNISDLSYGDAYLMLMGMALECLLKGCCVATKKKPQLIHNLATLATDLKIQISYREKEVLHILSEYIWWNGRYPVPLKHGELCSVVSETNPHESARDFNVSDAGELKVLNDLYERLLEICSKTNSQ